MSLFGSLMGDFGEDDPIFGHHMRSMRQMNSMMNSMFSDPFGMFDMHQQHQSALTGGHHQRPAPLMPFGFSSMPNINRFMNLQIPEGATSFSSSQVVSMTHGSDGRPQVYKATSSTKTGPGGIKETQKTVQDSRTGVKKMAIGHHIGDRAHIIEREQNVHTGNEEERQDFINLDEEEAPDFDREFTNRSRTIMGIQNSGHRHRSHAGNGQLAIGPAPPAAIMPPSNTSSTQTAPSSTKQLQNLTSSTNRRRSGHNSMATPRRPLRSVTSSPLTLNSTNLYTPATTSIHPHPYNASSSRRNSRPMKGSQQHHHHHQQTSGQK
ncbi:hypothetical protein HA402_008054 [Bradysia odoriphaga]|nr:hypothetical protein HA402_008054 [Bradysia odoriphaga]